MDRDRAITLLYKYYGIGLTLDESNEIISSYCKEKDKEDKHIGEFLLCIMVNSHIRDYCIHYAINYYRQKYNILELYRQSPNGPLGHRQIISIY